jgi:DNA repair exonuclease SbcCD ATPase subunit
MDGLRREAASVGLGGVPVGSVETVAELVEEARGSDATRHLRPLAAGAAVLAVAVAVGIWAAHLTALATAVGTGLLITAILLLAAERLAGGPAADARRRLVRLCPGLDLSPSGLERAAHRLPRLQALHADMRRQEAAVEAGRAELEEASERLAGIAQRCLVLAARVPVEVEAPAPVLPGPAGHLTRARHALAAVAAAAEAGQRRIQLEEEDARLADRLEDLRGLAEEAERCAAARADFAAEMRTLCDIPGLAVHDDPALQVAAFRQAASTRRQLDAARERLAEVNRRLSALGPADDAALARQAARLADELIRRGGDPGAVNAQLSLDPGHLHSLETAADHTRREAGAASTAATAMRERLAGVRDGLPSMADLEDERAACVAVRDRCLRQLKALRCAAVAIEEAARRVHRDAAPRLAAAIAGNLALITEGRYQEVHVNPERFDVTLRSPDRLELVPVELLSHGTRDQVGLLLRLALSEVLGQGGEPVPLLLDDPLQSSDPLRRAGLLDFLQRLSETTQVVLATSDPTIAETVVRSGVTSTVLDLGRRTAPSRAPARAEAPVRALIRGRHR